MAYPIVLAILLIVAAVVGRVLYTAVQSSRRPKDFPPGPPTLPILGNLTHIPTTKSFLKFHELSKQYGPLVGLKLGPQNMVVLNEYQPVQELFDRRGAIYSGRPENHIANDIIFQNAVHMLFIPYGDDWRRLRKTVQDLLRTSAVNDLLPIQNAESIQTMHHLLHSPDLWYDHIRRYSSSVILASVFGLRGASFDSPRVKALYHVQNQNTAINELGATPPVDIFPFLKSLPDFLSPWRKWAREIRTEYRAFLHDLVAESRENSKKEGAPDCFLNRMFREQGKNGLGDEHIAYLGTTLMEAGSDTTASTLLSFLLAMVKHPDVLRKCQEEVDSVCGNERSPTIEDIDRLPYVWACMQETLRWRPVAPGGIPHALEQDDHYNGYFLPKGTMLFANAWSIHRSHEFKDPDSFVPERFLESKFGIQTDSGESNEHRRPLYVFGASRRVCSGQKLAENSLMINIAKLAWAFDFTAPKGEKVDDSVETGYDGGFLICPKKFPLQITARSARHAEVIEKELEEVQPFLDKFGA